MLNREQVNILGIELLQIYDVHCHSRKSVSKSITKLIEAIAHARITGQQKRKLLRTVLRRAKWYRNGYHRLRDRLDETRLALTTGLDRCRKVEAEREELIRECDRLRAGYARLYDERQAMRMEAKSLPEVE